MKADSFKKSKKMYIDNMKLLPLQRFLPQPSIGKKGKGKGKGKDKGKGKGKGKGKDKGKRKGAAAMKSQFWERKKENENRDELPGAFTGTIKRYIFKFGWGLVEPDDVGSLPAKVKEALKKSNAEAKAKAEEKGKEFESENCIYFRKPDVDPTLFPLKDGQVINFEVYMDDKGVGAHNITSDEVDVDAEASA